MRRILAALLATLAGVATLVLGVAAPASAHVLPSSSVVLSVHDGSVDARLTIPIDDLAAATGIDLGSGSAAMIAAHESTLRQYLADHFQPSSAAGGAWSVSFGEFAVVDAEESGTGAYRALALTATLVPPVGADARVFDLGYDVVVERVVTHVVIVSLASDWLGGVVDGARELGTINVDSVSGALQPLRIDLGASSAWNGFASMVALGIAHLRDGVDHQLFLLTLLLPASLVAVGRRWSARASRAGAIRRVAAITLAFTIGHSITLAAGALGLAVPQGPVEVLIAVSILVAAVHAVRPIFAGREVLVAGGFGLVHGLAFSAVLRGLELSGGNLVVSLLGFNLGIELAQLAVVALVLPPLAVLASTRAFPALRIGAAIVTGAAAIAWIVQRLGVEAVFSNLADGLGQWSVAALVMVWGAAIAVVVTRRVRRGSSLRGLRAA